MKIKIRKKKVSILFLQVFIKIKILNYDPRDHPIGKPTLKSTAMGMVGKLLVAKEKRKEALDKARSKKGKKEEK